MWASSIPPVANFIYYSVLHAKPKIMKVG